MIWPGWYRGTEFCMKERIMAREEKVQKKGVRERNQDKNRERGLLTVAFADRPQFHQLACSAGSKNTDMLVMQQMINSPGSCKSFGPLNSALAQSQN